MCECDCSVLSIAHPVVLIALTSLMSLIASSHRHLMKTLDAANGAPHQPKKRQVEVDGADGLENAAQKRPNLIKCLYSVLEGVVALIALYNVNTDTAAAVRNSVAGTVAVLVPY